MSMAVRGIGPSGWVDWSWEGVGSDLRLDEGKQHEVCFLKLLFILSWGPQAQWPLEAGAPLGRVREFFNPHDQRAGKHQPGGL